MSRELSNGVIIPETTDSGDTVFSALETDLTLLNQALVDSSSHPAATLQSFTKTILPANWTVEATGGYKFRLTWSENVNAHRAAYMLFNGSQVIMTRVNVIGNKAIDVYINDNTLTIMVLGVQITA